MSGKDFGHDTVLFHALEGVGVGVDFGVLVIGYHIAAYVVRVVVAINENVYDVALFFVVQVGMTDAIEGVFNGDECFFELAVYDEEMTVFGVDDNEHVAALAYYLVNVLTYFGDHDVF